MIEVWIFEEQQGMIGDQHLLSHQEMCWNQRCLLWQWICAGTLTKNQSTFSIFLPSTVACATEWEKNEKRIFHSKGAKKVIFKACHSGKLKLSYTSTNVISTSPKNNSSKNFTYPSGKLRTKLTSPIAKSDTTFFACWLIHHITIRNFISRQTCLLSTFQSWQ